MTNNKPQARDVSALSSALAKPRQEIEEAFVSVGSRRSEGAAMLNRLTRQFEALPAALQGEEVSEASSQLRAVARTALQLTEDFAKEKADLTRLVEVVSAANGPISVLRRTVKMIGIVSINARVTAAGIVGDSDDFEVFTTDISTLSDSARSTIHEFSQVYRQLVTEVDQAAGQRDRFDAAHAHTLTELAHNLDETLEALDRQRQSAVESSAETGRVSRQIVGRIGSAVMALQVGDSTRQRLEHVEAGLDCLADIVGGAEFDAATSAQALTALSLLEQEQLRATAADFAGEVGEAEQALQALASDAGTIMARSRNLYGDGDNEASALAGAFGAAAGGDNAGQIGRLEQQANHAMTLLTQLDEGLSAAMTSLNADGPKVIAQLQAAARGIDGQSRLAESMDDIALQIAGLSSEAMPDPLAAELVPVLERLRKTYTMEAERQIHSRFFGGAVAAPVEEAADDMDLEALMF